LFRIHNDLKFDFGDGFEEFGIGLHRIPTTANLWCAGNELGSQVIVTPSVMEGVAFLAMNPQKFPNTNELFFIAIGNNYRETKMNRIRSACKKRKFTLVFGNDLVGRLTDIKVATALRGKSCTLAWSEPSVTIKTPQRSVRMKQEDVSLAAFERLAGIRTHIRTAKPAFYNTYLEQLKSDGNK